MNDCPWPIGVSGLALLRSDWPKLHRVLAILSVIGLNFYQVSDLALLSENVQVGKIFSSAEFLSIHIGLQIKEKTSHIT